MLLHHEMRHTSNADAVLNDVLTSFYSYLHLSQYHTHYHILMQPLIPETMKQKGGLRRSATLKPWKSVSAVAIPFEATDSVPTSLTCSETPRHISVRCACMEFPYT
jgi:hypothetical protein